MTEAQGIGGTNIRIEDYALIGNTHTAALVGRDAMIGVTKVSTERRNIQ